MPRRCGGRVGFDEGRDAGFAALDAD